MQHQTVTAMTTASVTTATATRAGTSAALSGAGVHMKEPWAFTQPCAQGAGLSEHSSMSSH